jgi:hypothetical protein
MLITEKESVFLKTLPMWAMGFAQIRLSKTMLDKSIIDANKSVRDLALNFGIDFDKMKNGDKYEVLARFDDPEKYEIIPCNNGVGEWEISPTHETFDTRQEAEEALKKYNQESVVRFYKTINRGDRRVSIKGIKQYANIGDLIALSACLPKDENKDIIIINVTRRADDE